MPDLGIDPPHLVVDNSMTLKPWGQEYFDQVDMTTEPEKLMIAGDWHHNTRWALKVIEYASKEGVDTILQLGDFGYWPARDPNFMDDARFVPKVAQWLRRYDMRLFWVDGNHEDHSLLPPGSGSDVVRHLPRGFRWDWWGKTWMSVGGGVSVDKQWRTQGVDWFPEEVLQPEQLEDCLRPGKVDIIVSHDTVNDYQIPGVHAGDKQDLNSFFPREAIQASEDHRYLLGQIVDETHPELLLHGHYHSCYMRTVERPYGKLVLRGLGMDGTSMADNTLILTRDDMKSVEAAVAA